MIKHIVFDFGDVFINLNKMATHDALSQYSCKASLSEINRINQLYETGQISTEDFTAFYLSNFKGLSPYQFKTAWNQILQDIPNHRLRFIQALYNDNQFELILLSNTNELHIDFIKNNEPNYTDFKCCFHGFYLSHLINMRKPNKDIFLHIQQKHQINPNEALFIDDLPENIATAQQLGYQTWLLDRAKEDVTELFKIKADLF